MTYRKFFVCAAAITGLQAGCTNSSDLLGLSESSQGTNAAIVGRIAASADTSKMLAASDSACPEIRVFVSGSPVSVEFDDECAFVIDGVIPAELVEVRVELVGLGVAGTVELTKVEDGELIEIVVEPGDDSLSVSVERRAKSDDAGELPEFINDNNLSLQVEAGVYEQGLQVKGNKFSLTGEAGENCDSTDGWTVITGEVLIDGNSATLRNIQFAGPVTIKGNNPRFINCCFGDKLVIFGNNAQIGEEDEGDDDDDKKSDEDEHEDSDDDAKPDDSDED